MTDILLIEDDDNDVAIYERAFGKLSFVPKVRRAHDGAEGLSLQRKKAADIIVLDLNMPGMDGHEFLHTLRGDGDTTPVIVLTTSHAARDIESTQETGADAFITKPTSLADLKHVVAAIERLHEWTQSA